MAVKLQDFIGGRINPITNPKHKVVSEFLTHNMHKNHGFDEKTAFIVEAVYEKILALSNGLIKKPTIISEPNDVPVSSVSESVLSYQQSAPTIESQKDIGSLIKRSENVNNDSDQMAISGKSALTSMTTKWS